MEYYAKCRERILSTKILTFSTYKKIRKIILKYLCVPIFCEVFEKLWEYHYYKVFEILLKTILLNSASISVSILEYALSRLHSFRF